MFVVLARDNIYAIARCMLSSSVRLSVTPVVDQSNTIEVRIMQLSPQSSPMIQLFYSKAVARLPLR